MEDTDMTNGRDKPRGGTVKRAVKAEDNLSSIAAEISAPTEVSIREVIARIEEAFTALGTPALPGTIVPCGQRNNAAEAAEFVLADKLVKLATDRMKNASQAADEAGVFGDPTSYVQGDTIMVFSDPNFTVSVKLGKPSKMLDREKVESAAVEYLGKRAPEFMKACMKDRAAPKTIIVSMK